MCQLMALIALRAVAVRRHNERMNEDDRGTSTPSLKEIEAQVLRIVSSKHFKNATQRRVLLEYLVVRSLDGKGSTEGDIAADVFPTNTRLQPESRAASVVPSQVRLKLKEFYEQHPTDRVLVRIPPVKEDSKYYVEFSYSRNPEATSSYELGLELIKSTTLASMVGAVNAFRRASELEPAFGLAYAALAEAEFCCALMYAVESEQPLSPAGNNGLDGTEVAQASGAPQEPNILLRIKRARSAAERAINLDPTLWKAHIIVGAVHATCFDWQIAERAFRTAIELAPEEGSSHPIYAAYLMALGRVGEAVRILSKKVEANPLNQLNHAVLSLFKAVGCIKPGRDPRDTQTHWLGQIASDMDHVWQQDAWEAQPIDAVIDFWNTPVGVWWFPLGLRHLGKMRFKKPFEHYEYRTLGSLATETRPYWEYVNFLSNLFDWTLSNRGPFHVAMAFVALAVIDTNAGIPSAWCDSVRTSVVQKSDPRCGYRANYAIAAVRCLELALDQNDPMMVWLHKWPFFAPLQKVERFQALVERMRLSNASGLGG